MATYWENSCSFGLRYVSWYKFGFFPISVFGVGFWVRVRVRVRVGVGVGLGLGLGLGLG